MVPNQFPLTSSTPTERGHESKNKTGLFCSRPSEPQQNKTGLFGRRSERNGKNKAGLHRVGAGGERNKENKTGLFWLFLFLLGPVPCGSLKRFLLGLQSRCRHLAVAVHTIDADEVPAKTL